MFGNGTGALATSSALIFSNSGSLLTVTNASSTSLSAQSFCLTNDVCRSTWPASGTSIPYAFPIATNGTTTLTNFFGGLGASASSTLGGNTVATGLTIAGGATSTSDFLHLGSTTLQKFTASQGTTTNFAISNLKDVLLMVGQTGSVQGTTTIGNNQLQQSAVTVNTNSPLGGGGAVSLGGTLTLTCTTCLTSAPFAYPFKTIGTGEQATGTAMSFQAGFLALGSGAASSTLASTTVSNFFNTSSGTTTNWSVGNNLMVGSSTPSGAAVTVGNGGSIYVGENKLSTSTSMTIDWNVGNQQLVQKGSAGVTITFSNVMQGKKLNLIVCNPDTGTGGTLTLPNSILWPGGTSPTMTTTANKCDLFTFLSTAATTTSGVKVFGGYNVNY